MKLGELGIRSALLFPAAQVSLMINTSGDLIDGWSPDYHLIKEENMSRILITALIAMMVPSAAIAAPCDSIQARCAVQVGGHCNPKNGHWCYGGHCRHMNAGGPIRPVSGSRNSIRVCTQIAY